ncbi:helix-turn-helix transcriptional regulator [Pseudomonas plecoglossicida]|uniref:helix-turn-helix transcriptional regulator n=1 Tax=Pseudomonas plecoglossicida TaxID=70775 RepID=UPI0013648446|nr:AraC family transcriptional regulator [Pseudomonas plecoglossicida]
MSPVEAYNARVSAEIAEMSVESDSGKKFEASWVRYGLGPIDLNFLRCESQKTTRSVEMTMRDPKPYFEFLYARAGKILVSHHGERTVVTPGSFILLSDQSPYQLEFPDASDCLTAHMPEDWLRTWVTAPQKYLGRPLGVGEIWTRPLVGLLTAVADSGLESITMPRYVLADQLGALSALMLNQQEETKHDSELFTRLKHSICERYQAHTISPKAIATEIGISTRHLHRVLSAAGTSFSSILTSTRLEQARRLLASPTQAHLPIGEIAWATGFVDQSHFARLFKAAYGITPTRFRAEH